MKISPMKNTKAPKLNTQRTFKTHKADRSFGHSVQRKAKYDNRMIAWAGE